MGDMSSQKLDYIQIPENGDQYQAFLQMTGADILEMAVQAVGAREELGLCDNIEAEPDRFERLLKSLGDDVCSKVANESKDVFDQISILCMVAQTCVLTAMGAVENLELMMSVNQMEE